MVLKSSACAYEHMDLLFIILTIFHMKKAHLRQFGVVLNSWNFEVEYTNGYVAFMLRMGKTSNYRFSINGMCMLELATEKNF